jgi:transcription elongation factor
MKLLHDFIDETQKNRKKRYKRIRIGAISDEAQKRIENICGGKIPEIDIDNSGVIHAIKKAEHNLQPDDLLNVVEVINTATDISISAKKHKSNDVLVFKKDIDGEITFLAEVHEKNGYLLVFNAWRAKKARRDATAQRPSANVQNESPRADG